MAVLININSCRLCDFCKYWWDPVCKYIQPNIGAQWYYDPNGKCRCIKYGAERPAGASCQYFRCKIEL